MLIAGQKMGGKISRKRKRFRGGRQREAINVIRHYKKTPRGFLANPPEIEGATLQRVFAGRLYSSKLRRGSLLAAAEAAAYMGCHPDTIRKLVRAGKLKSTRRNGMIRVSVRELERYLKATVGSRGRSMGANR